LQQPVFWQPLLRPKRIATATPGQTFSARLPKHGQLLFCSLLSITDLKITVGSSIVYINVIS
jgi:hypothetical protein